MSCQRAITFMNCIVCAPTPLRTNLPPSQLKRLLKSLYHPKILCKRMVGGLANSKVLSFQQKDESAKKGNGNELHIHGGSQMMSYDRLKWSGSHERFWKKAFSNSSLNFKASQTHTVGSRVLEMIRGKAKA
ncbi:unnamed protein product [Lactuca virosa]|uniref:Uncharacterized protein n=1 Tax=Lactuca virosa TaxID=75947 RepID=A0AAU9MM14_9ASTR|nr:unnamed protein product [Lactuca virosa]